MNYIRNGVKVMLSQIKEKPYLLIHYAIVLFMCFVFPQLTPIGALSPSGMALVGAFLGAVWGWSMIDMLWPSFVALFSMAWFMGANQVAAAAFGNVTVVMLMFMFIAMSCITQTGAVTWLIQKLLSLKFFAGKPWVTIGFFFYVAYLIAGLNSIIMAMILIPILKALFDTLGLEPYSKLPTLILIGVMYCLLMGQVTFPFMGVAFVLVSSYSAMFQTAIDFGSYLLFAVPLSVVMILIYLGIMKFVFRVDASPFKNFKPEMMGEAAPITEKSICCTDLLYRSNAVFFHFCTGSCIQVYEQNRRNGDCSRGNVCNPADEKYRRQTVYQCG